MPVSSPSYFGSVRSVDRIVGQNAGSGQTGARVFLAGLNAGRNSSVPDIVVIGSSALSAGITDANAAGAVVIGSNACAALTDLTGASTGPMLAVGGNACQLLQFGSGVYVGVDACRSMIGQDGFELGGNVVVGNEAGEHVQAAGLAGQFNENVVVGYRAARGGAAPAQFALLGNVVIGSEACDAGTGAAGSITNCVAIGRRAGRNLGAGGAAIRNTFVGESAGSNCTTTDDNTCIGASAGASMFGANNTLLGSNADVAGGNDNTLIGGSVTRTSGSRNILIGASAGNGDTPTNDDRFIVETFLAATRRNVLYGNLSAGNLVVGLSTPGVNRDLEAIACTNGMKLINGTRGAGNPAGGGFFYVSAGALHWVGSAGTDTVVAPA